MVAVVASVAVVVAMVVVSAAGVVAGGGGGCLGNSAAISVFTGPSGLSWSGGGHFLFFVEWNGRFCKCYRLFQEF